MKPLTFEDVLNLALAWLRDRQQRYIAPHPKRALIVAAVVVGLLIFLFWPRQQAPSNGVSNASEPPPTQPSRTSNHALLGLPDQPTAIPTTAITPTDTPPTFTPTPTPITFGDQTRVQPNQIRPGDAFVINATLHTPQDGSFKAIVEVYTASGNRVIDYAKLAEFQRGVPITFPVDEIATANDPAGTFRVRVALTSPDGTKTYYENQNAATFTLRN